MKRDTQNKKIAQKIKGKIVHRVLKELKVELVKRDFISNVLRVKFLNMKKEALISEGFVRDAGIDQISFLSKIIIDDLMKVKEYVVKIK